MSGALHVWLVSPYLGLVSRAASARDQFFAPVACMSRAVYAQAVIRDLRARPGRRAYGCLRELLPSVVRLTQTACLL